MPAVVKPVAFYLPQFHRIPENDRWWGEGFTEWTKVDAARPLFLGHHQPHVPSPPLGHYNLLDRETRLRQGELARAHGIHAFCYYHYWFAGKRLLEAPLEHMLIDGAPDLPFMLAWANEPWTRRWDGDEHEVLQPQEYGDAEDWSRHFDTLLRFFADPRYVRVHDCPVFLIYRAGHIPCLADMVAFWRARAREAGLRGLHLVGMLTSFDEPPETFAPMDAVCELFPSWPRRLGLDGVHLRGVRVSGARQAWRLGLDAPRLHRVQYRGAFASWDNTPRLGPRGYAFVPLTADELRERLLEQCRRTRDDAALPAPFIFFNAWNEWAEGCHLEPDAAHGTAWLEAVRDVVRACAERPIAAPVPVSVAPDLSISRPRLVRVDDADASGAVRLPSAWHDASAVCLYPQHPALRTRALEADVLVLGAVDTELVDIARARHACGRPTFVDVDAVLRRTTAGYALAPPVARLRLDLLGHLRAFSSPVEDGATAAVTFCSDGGAQERLRVLLEGTPSAVSVLGLVDLADDHAAWLTPLRLAARQLNDLREPQEAVRILQRVFACDAKDGDARCELARSLYLASREAEAQALLIETLTDSPWHVRGWPYLLRALGGRRSPATPTAESVATVARRAVESLPHNYVIGLQASACCAPADGGRLLLRVMENLETSLHPAEGFDVALVTGKVFTDLDVAWLCAAPSAVEALRVAHRLFPSSARVADRLGQVLWRLGEQAEGLAALAHADALRRMHATWRYAQR